MMQISLLIITLIPGQRLIFKNTTLVLNFPCS